MKIATTGKIEDYGTVIFKCYSGSKSYGTNIDKKLAEKIAKEKGGEAKDYISDVDIRGIFIPHEKYLYGRERLEQFNDPNEEDTVYFSLQKFIKMCYEGIPNAVELLNVDEKHILYKNEIGEDLLKIKGIFLSKRCFETFGSYAASQLKKMTVKTGEYKRNNKRMALIAMSGEEKYDTKNAMHLFRLLDMAIEILETSELKTLRPNREFLLKIRHGEFTLQEIIKMVEEKMVILEELYKKTKLPEAPSILCINEWLVENTLRQNNLKEKNTMKEIEKQYVMLTNSMVMAENKTALLVVDSLSKEMNKEDSFGVFAPYQDWYIGLEEDEELKIGEVSLDNVYKFGYGFLSCNPKHLFSVFAPKEYILHQNQEGEELKVYLKKHIYRSRVKHNLKGFVIGNLKKMEKWEKEKENHEKLRKKVKLAKEKTKTEWLEEIEKAEKKKEKALLMKEYAEWEILISAKKSLPFYPAIPKNTNNLSASCMGRYGYDTATAALLYQHTMLIKKIIENKYNVQLKEVLEESRAILIGKYRTFYDFKEVFEKIFEEVINSNMEHFEEKENLEEFYQGLEKIIKKSFI